MSDSLDLALWPATTVTNWAELARLCAEIATLQEKGRAILLRGQGCNWGLRPSLLRIFPREVAVAEIVRAERASLAHFQSHAHLYASEEDLPQSQDDLEWFAALQHFGAPTRLLDWTSSPYIAAYFAAEQHPDDDGIIAVIDGGAALRHFADEYGQLRAEHIFTRSEVRRVATFTPRRRTRRLMTQQGYFTVATHPDQSHDGLLADAGAIIGLWVLPRTTKLTILHHLRSMNVSGHVLFPGLDGLGRSTGEIARSASTT